MTKKKMNELALELCAKHDLSVEATADFDMLTKPKSGGATIEEIVVRDSEGTVTHIFDTFLSIWIPVFDEAGEENFYAKEGTELGWSRQSKAAEKLRKSAEKTFKATEKAVLADLLSNEVTADEAQEILGEAKAARADVVIPDGLGSTEKPEA